MLKRNGLSTFRDSNFKRTTTIYSPLYSVLTQLACVKTTVLHKKSAAPSFISRDRCEGYLGKKFNLVQSRRKIVQLNSARCCCGQTNMNTHTYLVGYSVMWPGHFYSLSGSRHAKGSNDHGGNLPHDIKHCGGRGFHSALHQTRFLSMTGHSMWKWPQWLKKRQICPFICP